MGAYEYLCWAISIGFYLFIGYCVLEQSRRNRFQNEAQMPAKAKVEQGRSMASRRPADDAQKMLLRACSAPDLDSLYLVRPSMGGTAAEPKQLLRPLSDS